MADAGRGIKGTFYPDDGPRAGTSGHAGIAKLVAVLVAMAVIRNVMALAKRHGGGSHWSRRREAIAELHRDLHARDAEVPPAADDTRA
jgi:hypothetical protein